MQKIKQKLLSGIINLLNFIFASITLALLIVALFRPDLVKIFLEWIWNEILLLWNWNYLVAFLSAMIESFPVVWVLVPWMQVMLLVWWFFRGHFIVWVIIVAILWAIIGNYAGYYLWVRYWESFFKNYWDWFWLWKTELKILKKQIDKNWALFIILWKFHNFTRAFVPFIAWSMGMHKQRFWFYNIMGSIIWAVTIITLWVIFVEYYKKIIDNLKYILGVIFFLVILYIAFFKRKEFMEYLKDKNAEIDEKVKS